MKPDQESKWSSLGIQRDTKVTALRMQSVGLQCQLSVVAVLVLVLVIQPQLLGSPSKFQTNIKYCKEMLD